MATFLLALRNGLDKVGLNDKLIGYTTRFNAFFDDSSRPFNATVFATDGEGIFIDNALKAKGSSIKKVVSFTNIMFYGVTPAEVGVQDAITIKQYREVFNSFETYFDPNQIVMGFMPNSKSATEDLALDNKVIEDIQINGYGGIMFWAINGKGLGKDSN